MSLSKIVLFAFLLLAANLVVLVSCDSDDTLSQGEMRSVRLFESHSAALQSASNRFHNLADSSASVAASLVVLVPALTVGPYFTEVSDFVSSSDLLAAAKAGASGVTTDRLSVLDGAPLSLTLNIYNVSGSIGYPIEGATVFIWHCDGYGVYSAVSSASGNPENTLGQKWLRGYQTTTSTGTVTFNTIIPGWYTGRTVHQHIRVHLPTASNDTYVITTQLFPSTAVINAVSSIYPYSSDTQSYTALTADSIYSSVSSTLASEIILNTTGSSSGYSSVFNLGIDLSSAASTTTSSPGGGGSQTNGASTTGTTSSSASLLKLFTYAHLFIPALVSITVVFLYQM